MTDIAPRTGRPLISKPRARKEAAKKLAVHLQARYRVFLEASGDNEITVSSGALAQCMYENVEFILWALKTVAGMNPAPPEELRRISPAPPMPANDDPRFAKPPEIQLEDFAPVKMECNCPPLEHGIIGRERHMTSCPKYVP